MNMLKKQVIFSLSVVLSIVFLLPGSAYCQQEFSSSGGGKPSDYQELLEKYEQLKTDRDNLLAQIKKRLGTQRGNDQAVRLAEDLKKLNKDLQEKNRSLRTEIGVISGEVEEKQLALDNLRQENITLENENEQLVGLQDKSKVKEQIRKISREKDKQIKELKTKYELEIKTLTEKLKKQNRSHKKSKKQWEKDFKTSKEDWEAYNLSLRKTLLDYESKARADENLKTKSDAMIKELQYKIEKLEGENKAAKEANLSLRNELKEVPTKFRRLARHNEILSERVADMHYNFGVFYADKRDYKRAIKEFTQAIDLRPYDKDSIFNIGLIYAEHEVDRAKAIYFFQKYIQLDPNSSNAEWAKKYILKWEAWRREAKDITR